MNYWTHGQPLLRLLPGSGRQRAVDGDLVASGQYGSYIISPGAIEKGHDWMQEGQGYGTGPYKFDTLRR